jgi:hypothetical protein
MACCSNHPAGAAHEPGNFGTLSTLSLLSESSGGHVVLLQEHVNRSTKDFFHIMFKGEISASAFLGYLNA